MSLLPYGNLLFWWKIYLCQKVIRTGGLQCTDRRGCCINIQESRGEKMTIEKVGRQLLVGHQRVTIVMKHKRDCVVYHSCCCVWCSVCVCLGFWIAQCFAINDPIVYHA